MNLKRIIAVFLCLAVIFTLTACKYRLKESYYEVGEIDGVILVAEKVTSTEGTFILKNETDKAVGYGSSYYLERYKNGEWKYMSTGTRIAFTAELAVLESDRWEEINMNWKRVYGKLPKGKYRYIKDCCLDDGPFVYIACEFEIK